MRTCNPRPDRGPHYLVRGPHLLAGRERERARASYGGIGYHNLITLLSTLCCVVFSLPFDNRNAHRPVKNCSFVAHFLRLCNCDFCKLGFQPSRGRSRLFSYVFSLTACAWIEDFDILFRAHVSVG